MRKALGLGPHRAVKSGQYPYCIYRQTGQLAFFATNLHQQVEAVAIGELVCLAISFWFSVFDLDVSEYFGRHGGITHN